MITDCFGTPQGLFGLDGHVFFIDVGLLMIAAVPAAIVVALWKIFVTNRITPRGNVLALGLNETSATKVELYGRGIPWRALFLRASLAAVTFQLGVFSFDLNYYVQDLLRSYFSID